MFFDSPWFGSRDWKTMYDYPHYAQIKQHMPITLPWALADTRKIIARNNAFADKAVLYFSQTGLDSAKAFIKDFPGIDRMDARVAGLKAILAEAAMLAGAALDDPKDNQEKDYAQAYKDIKSSLVESERDFPVFRQKAAELHAALAGKAVLIGGTSTALGDLVTTPLHDECPGVVVHGVIFNAIISGHFWRSAPPWVNLLVTIIAGILTTALVARHHALPALASTLLLGGFYVVLNSIVLFDYGKWIVGMAGPVVAMMLIWGALTLIRLIAEAHERARITRRFSSYVDPSLVQYVIDHPELARLEGEVREMTVCFTDLAGFTTMTEKLREKAVKILGRYIVRMVPPIRRNSGFVHRFMGDGIMFSYGAPIPNANMAIDAVNTVLQMHEELSKLNEELVAEGYSALGMRAGVNTGMAVVGDSGADDASEYACLGDTTNLAARLEGANSFTGTRSLISARTVELLDGKFLLRPIARLIVAGKSQSVMTYEPLAPVESATDSQKRLAQLTMDMFEHFVAARFAECIAAANRLDEAFGESKLTAIYREACATHLTDPPAEFHGNIVLRGK
jgi:adenylate cyclase